ncbi:MAG: hypothetical protein ACE14M_13580 [Terriglobales bacterium]
MRRYFVVLSLLTASCFAADRVNIKYYGCADLKHCQVEHDGVMLALQTLHFPNDWTIYIMCSRVHWEDARIKANSPNTRTAFTLLDSRLTVINGAIFGGLPGQYRRILAHELGHIECQCADEEKVQKIAHRLLNQKAPKHAAKAEGRQAPGDNGTGASAGHLSRPDTVTSASSGSPPAN